jgi:hypothetical protein
LFSLEVRDTLFECNLCNSPRIPSGVRRIHSEGAIC